MVHSRRSPKCLAMSLRFVLVTSLLFMPALPVRAADQKASDSAKDQRIAQLEAHVRQLEEHVKQLKALLAEIGDKKGGGKPLATISATREQRDALILKARHRARQDRNKHSAEELQECERLYQVANKNWRTPEAKTSLETMLAKYSDVNRTGCALVYMAQMSAGEEKEKYLKQAIEKFSDCYYLNGVQVGPWARALLGYYYQES